MVATGKTATARTAKKAQEKNIYWRDVEKDGYWQDIEEKTLHCEAASRQWPKGLQFSSVQMLSYPDEKAAICTGIRP
eukprot:13556796-Heterocapsa_arctica.AAC.1